MIRPGDGRPLARLMSIGLVLLWWSVPAFAEEGRQLRGVALVVGNGDYEHLPDLPNPANDARAMDDLLVDLGFDTSVSSDRDGKRLKRDLERFAEDAEGADVAILYYSGHGIEAGGENYLVPVDAELASLDEAAEKLVPLSAAIQELRATVPVVIILLDACRNSPFPAGASLRPESNAPALPVAAAGLGEPRGAEPLKEAAPFDKDVTLGTVIAFAAEPGKVALDGIAGTNSPYAAALLKHLGAGDAAFSDIMTMVTEEVYVETQARQRPWVNASLRRLLYFGSRPEEQGSDEARLRGARRELLLTIAATPEEMRGFVEALARQDDLPLDQLYGMLKELEVDTSGGPDQLEAQLRSGADNLKRFMAERVAPARTDPELIRLSGLADRAQQEGAIRLAKEYREKASARADELARVLDTREDDLEADRLQLAATYAEHAETAILAFDHLTASEKFEAAAGQAGRWNADLVLDYRFRAAQALADHGNFKGDNTALEQAIEKYRAILELRPRASAPLKWAETQNMLGSTLRLLGERESGTARLEQAVAAHQAALDEWTREREPLDWARAQNGIGNALQVLGFREGNTARLKGAVAAYRAALEERTRERVPLEWAMTQNNLGGALEILGRRESGTSRLAEAVAAYRAALEERSRERAPLDWAATQNNLGNVLQELGRRESGTTRLEEAVKAYRAALEEYTRERVPLDWAMTQNNLGIALAALGERENGTERLEEAVAAYRAALEERTRERVPLEWATTQNNLGAALVVLGRREIGTARLKEAVLAYRAALDEWTRERVPLDWATTQNNLGNALVILGSRESGKALLEEAVLAFKAALEERPRELVPLDWATTQNSLGAALETLGSRESGTARLKDAVMAYKAALEERTRERVPLDWAMTQTNVGTALTALGSRESGTARLEEAVAAFKAALKERTRERVPLDWARVQYGLGNALTALGSRDAGTARLEEAVATFRAALEEQTQERAAFDRATTQNDLGGAILLLGQRRKSLPLVEQGRHAVEQSWEQYRASGVTQLDAYYTERLAEADRLIAELRASLPAAVE